MALPWGVRSAGAKAGALRGAAPPTLEGFSRRAQKAVRGAAMGAGANGGAATLLVLRTRLSWPTLNTATTCSRRWACSRMAVAAGGGFFHQRRVLLRHLIQIANGAVDLANAVTLLQEAAVISPIKFADAAHALHDLLHALAGLFHLLRARIPHCSRWW